MPREMWSGRSGRTAKLRLICFEPGWPRHPVHTDKEFMNLKKAYFRCAVRAGSDAGARRMAADDLQQRAAQARCRIGQFSHHLGGFRVRLGQTDPISDKDVQKGTVYYKRKGRTSRWRRTSTK